MDAVDILILVPFAAWLCMKLAGGHEANNDFAPQTSEQRANAHLISAAPELLESLEEILYYEGGADNALEDEYVMQRAFDAVKKAYGES